MADDDFVDFDKTEKLLQGLCKARYAELKAYEEAWKDNPTPRQQRRIGQARVRYETAVKEARRYQEYRIKEMLSLL